VGVAESEGMAEFMIRNVDPEPVTKWWAPNDIRNAYSNLPIVTMIDIHIGIIRVEDGHGIPNAVPDADLNVVCANVRYVVALYFGPYKKDTAQVVPLIVAKRSSTPKDIIQLRFHVLEI
jgi:hypothetical protein